MPDMRTVIPGKAQLCSQRSDTLSSYRKKTSDFFEGEPSPIPQSAEGLQVEWLSRGRAHPQKQVEPASDRDKRPVLLVSAGILSSEAYVIFTPIQKVN